MLRYCFLSFRYARTAVAVDSTHFVLVWECCYPLEWCTDCAECVAYPLNRCQLLLCNQLSGVCVCVCVCVCACGNDLHFIIINAELVT